MSEWVGRKPALTPHEARTARYLVRKGWKHYEVARIFGVNRSTIGTYTRREHKRREYA
jgi:transposase